MLSTLIVAVAIGQDKVATKQPAKDKPAVMIKIDGAPNLKPLTPDEKAARKKRADAELAKTVATKKSKIADAKKRRAEALAAKHQANLDRHAKIGDRCTSLTTIAVVDTDNIFTLGRLAQAGDAVGMEKGLNNKTLIAIEEGTHIILLNPIRSDGVIWWQVRMIDGKHEGKILNVISGSFHVGT
jgi:hypothetical protein